MRVPARKLLYLQDLDDPSDNRRDGLVVKTAGPVEDQASTGRKESVWPNVARFSERPLREIDIGDTDGVAIPDLLARDLTENDIIPIRRRDNKSRPSFHG